MKFTCIPNLGKHSGGLVWDKETNRTIAEFDGNGEFETEDETVIAKLKEKGFKVIDEPEEPSKAKKGRKNTPENE